MAITVSALTVNHDNVDRTSYSTASINPTGPCILGVSFVRDESGTEPTLPSSVTGCGLTWTWLWDEYWKSIGTSVRYKLAVYQGVGTPSSGAVTFAFTGYTCVHCSWAVLDLVGADATSPIVGGQVNGISSDTTAGSTVTVSLASGAGNADDRCVSFAAGQNAVSSYTPEGTWTELGEAAGATPNQVIQAQWRSDAFDQSASVTNGTASAFRTGLIMAEIAIAGGGEPPPPTSHGELTLLGVG